MQHYRDPLTLPLFPAGEQSAPNGGVVRDEQGIGEAVPAEVHGEANGVSAAVGGQDLKNSAERAQALMSELGLALRGASLQSTGWSFAFDRARTRLGCCSWERVRGTSSKKVISISRPFSEAHGWGLMEDVVRHEIAHALDVDT